MGFYLTALCQWLVLTEQFPIFSCLKTYSSVSIAIKETNKLQKSQQYFFQLEKVKGRNLNLNTFTQLERLYEEENRD